MALTYQLIASTTVGSGGASTIDFTSIPATYTDLIVKVSCRTNNTGAGNAFNISLNGSTTNFTNRSLYGSGGVGSPGSGTGTRGVGFVNGTGETASTFASTDIYIPNYTGSNNKSMSSDSVMEDNASTAYAGIFALLWSNSAAITSITLTPQVGNFVQYSTAYLYGIKNS